MVQSLRWLSLLAFANALFACPFAKGFGRGPDTDTENATSNAGVYADASVRGDACPPGHKETMAAKPTGCGMAEQCNDGLDNDCNGKVDEGCACSPGQVQKCFLGPPERRGLGVCSDGMQTCQGSSEFGVWSDCMGGIAPSGELCNDADDNCDGRVDDGLCCRPAGTCPSSEDIRVPVGKPFARYELDGMAFFPGPARSWRWHVVGGPCDRMLYATSKNVSYKIMGASKTEPRDATTQKLTFYPTLSGDYTVTLAATPMVGPPFECTFLIKVRAPGLRAELCWDHTGDADLDLWLHQPGNVLGWVGDNDHNTCWFNNCLNDQELDWGYAPTPGKDCRQPTPKGCNNPRLDIDNQDIPGLPENINIDLPKNGEIFRVAVNYYETKGTTTLDIHPMVNIYCGGALKATYGGVMVGSMLHGSQPIRGFNQATGNLKGSLWRVVDVLMKDSGSCDVALLVPKTTPNGVCVDNNGDRTFSGSCQRRATMR